MDNLVICRENGDKIITLSLKTYKVNFKEMKYCEIYLGAHAIKGYKDNLIVVNSFSNNIVILNRNTLEEEDVIYVGSHPKDLICFNDRAFVICAESNSLLVVDLEEKDIIAEVECGDYPHSIVMDEVNEKAVICNMYNHEINIIDLKNMIKEKSFYVGTYPTRMVIKDNKLIVCESYIGEKKYGYISSYSLEDGRKECSCKVGMVPVDICIADDKYYVANMCNGSVSVLDSEMNIIDEIMVGGMPQNIICYKNEIYVLDSDNGNICVVNLKDKGKRNIAIGKEPTTMTLQYFR